MARLRDPRGALMGLGRSLSLLPGACLVWACGSAEPPTGGPEPVARVEVSPSTAYITVGATQAMTAMLWDARGSRVTDRSVAWSSSNPGSAAVSPQGVVTGVAVGSATITALAEGRSGSASLGVVAPVTLGLGLGPDQFAYIPPGTFEMGSASGDSDERPVHTVVLTKAFYLQRTEVTQGQWQAVMGSNPSVFKQCGERCPVGMVSWMAIQEFLTRVNAANPGAGFRLPTEAEWEYAARAGSQGAYGGSGVLADMGWYRDNANATTHAVAQKQPNAWGLYDMHGNVYEWVQDWYSSTYYASSPLADPAGPSSGTARVMRGGSWDSNTINTRSSARVGVSPDAAAGYPGFRLVRGP